MSKTILMRGAACVSSGWYITQWAGKCRCEARQIINRGELAPPCPKCGSACNWVLIEKPSGMERSWPGTIPRLNQCFPVWPPMT